MIIESFSEDDMEIWEESCPDSETENENAAPPPDMPQFSHNDAEKQHCMCLSKWLMRFLLILQAKFRLPDKSMDYLLRFIYTFLCIVGTFSSFIKMLVRELPPTLHIIHKKVGLPNSFKKFIVCTKCSSIYEYKDCVNRITSVAASKHCTYIAYPHHPHLQKRQPCNTVLLKTVEFTSGRTILYPRLLYCYKSLKDSLQELLLNAEFVSNCHLWKKQTHTDCTNLNSIYDGNIWKEFFNVVESPSIKYSFSTNKYSFGFSLNIDWFQPYTHTTSSVGVIYITVLNLPRFIRYKRENVILIGIFLGHVSQKRTLTHFCNH